MPANNTNQIQVGVPVVALAAYQFSKQDTEALLSEIPGGGAGTVLTLPEGEIPLEAYAFADVDGSCSAEHPVIVRTSAGQEVQGLSQITFEAPFAWACFKWAGTQWSVETGTGTPTQAEASGFQHQTANTITLTASPATLASVTVTPNSSGRFRVWGNVAVTNTDSGAHVATISVTHTTTGNTNNRTVPGAAVDEQVGILAITDVQTLGTPVTIALQGADAAASGDLLSVGGGAATWIYVEEISSSGEV